MKYKHIFFDLDHTLWDYEKNSWELLEQLVHKHILLEKGVSDVTSFIKEFERVNFGLWGLFNKGKIHKDEIRKQRFLQILETFGIKDIRLSNDLSEEYLMECPKKQHVFPFTYETLDYLKEHYILHVLTNGFNDVQYTKINAAKLEGYFTSVVTSDSAGYKKPDSAIFHYALDKASARKHESVMIGDNLQTDILGARNFGIDHIYFNPSKVDHKASVTHEIDCLSQLKEIL